MSASCVLRNVTLRAYNGRYLSRLAAVSSNCELCSCKTVTRSFSTRSDRCVFRFYRQFLSHVRVRVTCLRPVCNGMTKYRKGPTKDRKGALHRTTEDRQYHKRPTKDCKGTLLAKLQEIGTD